jgi:hypothetical protein
MLRELPGAGGNDGVPNPNFPQFENQLRDGEAARAIN